MNASIKLVLAWAGLISSMCFIGSASAGAGAENSAQTQKPGGLPNFEAIAAGKRQFLIHGEVRPLALQKIAVFCSGFESSTCNKTLETYNGMRGVLLADNPSYKNSLYYGYPILLENGERLIYRMPRWRELDNVFDASDYIFDSKDIEHAKAMVDRRLSPNIGARVTRYELKHGTLMLLLDTGERLSLAEITQRLAVLNAFVGVENHQQVFSALSKATLRRQDQGQWLLMPISALDMPLYGELLLGGLKQLRMVVNHKDFGGINFNQVRVSLKPDVKTPIYVREFEYSDIVTSSSGGRLIEQAVVPVAEAEARVLATVADTPVQITLDGPLPFEGTLTAEQAEQLRAVLHIYALIALPESGQLASR